MEFPSPKLDHRTFVDLVEDAKATIRRVCPEWTDLSPHDPGMCLVEVFAHMTETFLFRLNQLPDTAYIELLRLIGVRLEPPTAAATRLRFSLEHSRSQELMIPHGAAVTGSRGNSNEAPLTFTTDSNAVIPAGELSVEVTAHHAEWVRVELLGRTSGLPSQVFQVKQAPIVANTGDAMPVTVFVEAEPGDPSAGVEFQNRRYHVWREVRTFGALTPAAPNAFIVDRVSGTIQFPPALSEPETSGVVTSEGRLETAVPPRDRFVLVSYFRGGGAGGNVPQGTLTVIKTPVPGATLKVEQVADARGGRAAETLEDAKRRGPLEFFTLERAVTAQDFEVLARRVGGIARAKAFTSQEIWAHANAGAVDVLLVPALEPGEQASLSNLMAARQEPLQTQVVSLLNERKPMGVHCFVRWAKFKQVRVLANVVVDDTLPFPDLQERPPHYTPSCCRFRQAAV